MDPTVIVVIVVAVIALGIGGWVVVWKKRQNADDDEVYHFLCPGCKRRLSYLGRQAGHKGKCNRCGRVLDFPPTSASID